MPRDRRSSTQETPSQDVGWLFGTPTDNTRHNVRCNFCGKVVRGGITRLKQHLGHITGQVASCPNVSNEVRIQMMQHLQGNKEKKIAKKKRQEELASEIRGDLDDVSDDELEERLFRNAQEESMRSQQQWEDRQRFRARTGGSSNVYEEGGGSGSRRPGVDERHAGSGRQWINPDNPDARLRAMDPIYERSRSAKQPKIKTSFMKGLRTKLGSAVSKFFIYNRIPMHVASSPFMQPMLDIAGEVGRGVKGPTPYDISEVYLAQEDTEMKRYISSFTNIWKERGVTIMCDGWTGPTRNHIINFLIYSNKGTVFHKSVDASDVPSRTGEYYFKLMDQVVQDIGEENVVQVVTDNEAAMKLGGKLLMEKRPHLYWSACAAHCLDLILEDIGKKKAVAKVLEDAKKITSFIYNHTWTVNYMKRFTEGKELLRPAVTRFATNFIALETILKQKAQLKNMFTSDTWMNSKFGKAKQGPAYEASQIVLGKDFWRKAADVCNIHEPLVKVLRLVDGDEKPTMGFIYEAVDRAKRAIEQNCQYYKDIWKIIDRRWNIQLHQDLHAAGYFLNPQLWYLGTTSLAVEREVLDGTRKVIQRMEPSLDDQVRAIGQLLRYKDKDDSFGTELAQRAIKLSNPAEWWINFGSSAPELQRIAVKVLSQTTSASNCERNWSTFSLIHTKTRNRLKYNKLQKLVFVHYNMKLKLRHTMRKSQAEIDQSFNPINLDYIFDEDDPLSPWLEEREAPILDGHDNSQWLSLEEEDDDETQPPDDDLANEDESNRNGSDNEGGLSPPSDDDGNGGGNEGGELQPHESSQFETGMSFVPETYEPDQGLYGMPDNYDIRTGTSQTSRGGGRRRQIHDPYGMVQNFGNFGIEGSYPFSYEPHNYAEQEDSSGSNIGLFHYVLPQGWTDNDSQSNVRSEDVDDNDYQEPARRSLWW